MSTLWFPAAISFVYFQFVDPPISPNQVKVLAQIILWLIWSRILLLHNDGFVSGCLSDALLYSMHKVSGLQKPLHFEVSTVWNS